VLEATDERGGALERVPTGSIGFALGSTDGASSTSSRGMSESASCDTSSFDALSCDMTRIAAID